MRTLPRVIAFAAAAALLAGSPGAATAQQTQPSGEGKPAAGADPSQQPLPPPGPPSSYAVGERPAPVEKTYRKKTKKVWPALLDVLREADVPIETMDEATGYIKTQLIAFDHTRFFNVATPPPDISRERPIGQRVGLNRGNFSVEFLVLPAGKGTLVSVRPYIEEHAHQVAEGRRIWVERYSNGTIEKYFLDRLDLRFP